MMEPRPSITFEVAGRPVEMATWCGDKVVSLNPLPRQPARTPLWVFRMMNSLDVGGTEAIVEDRDLVVRSGGIRQVAPPGSRLLYLPEVDQVLVMSRRAFRRVVTVVRSD